MKFYPADVRSHQRGLNRQVPVGRGLRLLSYNIQAAVYTRHYRDYVTKGWKHLLPNRERLRNLNLIADMLHGYDLVGLQEVDSGSLRSGFVDMTEYLAHRSGYPHWYHQVNRNMGVLGQHSNGFLSRIRPTRVSNHRLPPGNGRGAMLLEFGEGADALVVCSMHLALSRRVRTRQLDFINELVGERRHLIVMGDLNAGCDSREVRDFIDNHEIVYVVEQNRDAQLRTLLINDIGADQDKLVSLLHYNGMPINSGFVVDKVLDEIARGRAA